VIKLQIPYLKSVQTLRGFASIIVLLHHIWIFYPKIPFLYLAMQKMYLGVELFFVISGFIIPYSMFAAGYKLKNIGLFLWKRILRIDPPYLVMIAITLIINFLLNRSNVISFYNLLLHIAYLIPFTHEKWVSNVFWTLAIEFQYYLIIAFTFPLLIHKNRWVILFTIAAILSLNLISHSVDFLPRWVTYFVMGIVTFYFKINKINRNEYIIAILALGILLKFQISTMFALVGIMSAFYLAFASFLNRITDFFGKISYSLYISHCSFLPLISYFLINSIGINPNFHIILFSLSFIICVIIAYIFYMLIEKYFAEQSKKISYHKKATMLTDRYYASY
jgi:peptidoglycan/LPS O-acetylase OafA/YrhL